MLQRPERCACSHWPSHSFMWNEISCTKLQLPPEPLTRGLLSPDPRSLCPVLNWIFWTPSKQNSWARHWNRPTVMSLWSNNIGIATIPCHSVLIHSTYSWWCTHTVILNNGWTNYHQTSITTWEFYFLTSLTPMTQGKSHSVLYITTKHHDHKSSRPQLICPDNKTLATV